MTPFPCPRRAVFVMFPGDTYTGWYSWWPVATETVVLSLPQITGTNIAPCVEASTDILSYANSMSKFTYFEPLK